MKIKVTREFQLSDMTGIKFQPGNELDVSDNIGQKCIKAGVAVEIKPARVNATTKQAETTELPQAEDTMIKSPAKKKAIHK